MQRAATNRLRRMLDSWLPAVVRERSMFGALGKIWLGPGFDPYFKSRGWQLSDRQLIDAYARLGNGVHARRETDTTPLQRAWLLDRIGSQPQRILEIGPGGGQFSETLRALGHRVFAINLFPAGLERGLGVLGVAERLPFADRSVDVVVLAHVLEHVRSLTATSMELGRVARKKLLIVTPQQRYFRFTFDYHLHFFHSLGHLASHLPGGGAATDSAVLDNDLCLEWKVRES